jgi:hypothetical protein
MISITNGKTTIIRVSSEEGFDVIKIDKQASIEQFAWLLRSLATFYEQGEALEVAIKSTFALMKRKNKDLELIEVRTQVSFEEFWDRYGFKVGKKERVKKKWEAMDKEEQVKAYEYIRKYKMFLAERPHIQQKYPETYLNTAEWNN